MVPVSLETLVDYEFDIATLFRLPSITLFKDKTWAACLRE